MTRKRASRWTPNVPPWLQAQRGKKKQDAVIADLEGRGVHIDRSWLSRIENGAPFSDDLLDAFEDYYQSVAPPYVPEDEPDQSDLAAAIREQAQAINALVREIQLSRTAQIAATSAVFEILGVKDRPPYPEDTPDGSEHEAPVATGR